MLRVCVAPMILRFYKAPTHRSECALMITFGTGRLITILLLRSLLARASHLADAATPREK